MTDSNQTAKPDSNQTAKLQTIYNTVCKHLLSMSDRSREPETGICVYRGPNNTKCAAGILIPDKLYKPHMEGRDFNTLCVDFPEIDALFSIAEQELILHLQNVHDDCVNWPDTDSETKGLKLSGRKQLQQIAFDFDLTPYPVLKLEEENNA